jgi:uncharacterized protein YqeY
MESMTLKGQIREDMISALKAGEKDRLKTVRLIIASIKQIEIDQRIDLDDAAVLGVLHKMLKQRRDSVSQFQAGGRDDLAAIETDEIAIIEQYLPAAMSDAELDDLIGKAISETGAAGIRDMGRVMGKVKAMAEGRADMSAVGAKVKAILGQTQA